MPDFEGNYKEIVAPAAPTVHCSGGRLMPLAQDVSLPTLKLSGFDALSLFAMYGEERTDIVVLGGDWLMALMNFST